jgi:hypothetical protein
VAGGQSSGLLGCKVLAVQQQPEQLLEAAQLPAAAFVQGARIQLQRWLLS